MQTQYTWKGSGRWFDAQKLKASAQDVGECLQQIQEQVGELTPQRIVDEARDVTSILHPAFEWNDVIAAEAHRRTQARHIVQSVRVVMVTASGTKQESPAFVNVRLMTDEDHSEASYVSLTTVLSNEALYQQVCARAMREMEAWQSRYREYKALASIGKQAATQIREQLEQTTEQELAQSA